MYDEEQVYPIDTAAEVEDVSGLSAFQVRFLVLAANPEAMYGAAKDYLCTAERLEATADGIRRGATDLAEAWHGSAADASQHQMQQYYASARSLATACRASAAAFTHAAAALTAAQVQVLSFPGGDLPSLDPTSIQSLCYQKALADLNAAYRDAITLAPTQIAVTLPRGNYSSDPERSVGAEAELEDMQTPDTHSLTMASLHSSGTSDVRMGDGPIKGSPSIPANPTGGGSFSPDRSGPGAQLGSTSMASGHPAYPEVIYPAHPEVIQDFVRPEMVRGAEVSPHQSAGSAYMPASSLAGGNGGDASLGMIRHADGVYSEIPSRDVRATAPIAGSMARSTNADLVGQNGGILPYGSGLGEGGQQRERRYYLKEEREVWGAESVPPAILYGEQAPPSPAGYDDDDDDF